ATLSWGAVTNADSVSIEPGIGGVVAPGTHTVAPMQPTTYTLTARCGAAIATRQVTIVVTYPPTRTFTPTTKPSDTQGPPAPSLVSPKGTLSSCRTSVTLDWNAVSDPSGIKNYIVKWVRDDGQSGGTVTTSTQHTISLTCDNKSHTYTWSVQAEDNAGNRGATSSATFTNPAGLY
ncbi:MAG: fibronectin type III domain-containing protein, partial [Anaerolineales bacterium]|nr:fibronectin type III domain-containing protein [Anaerolineales bacterium]